MPVGKGHDVSLKHIHLKLDYLNSDGDFSYEKIVIPKICYKFDRLVKSFS
jgi:hypothetical protein